LLSIIGIEDYLLYCKIDRRPFARFSLSPHAPALSLDDPIYNGKADPCACKFIIGMKPFERRITLPRAISCREILERCRRSSISLVIFSDPLLIRTRQSLSCASRVPGSPRAERGVRHTRSAPRFSPRGARGERSGSAMAVCRPLDPVVSLLFFSQLEAHANLYATIR